jgi:fructosamine-3-kinase
MIPAAVQNWLDENHCGKVTFQKPVGGGCINSGMVLFTQTGPSFFLKLNQGAPPDMFQREAEGLLALQVKGGPEVPEPYLYGADFLLMEDISPAAPCFSYWKDFGHALAALHSQRGSLFGFQENNYIGSTPQPNPWTENGHDFFAQKRLLYMANLASGLGLLDRSINEGIARLASRLRALVPEQPPSLIHGDLWSGNATTDRQGRPAIIDPAAHYGWAEAELAMTSLFGGFPGLFYRAYEEARPLEPGYQERFPIYNLYHLLNHVVLFGRGYLGQVKAILHHFS